MNGPAGNNKRPHEGSSKQAYAPTLSDDVSSRAVCDT